MSDDSQEQYKDNAERIRTRLAGTAESGEFMDAVLELWGDPTLEFEELGHQIAVMHNEGIFDIVHEFSSLTKGPSFFELRHVFETALPDLEAEIPDLLRCVDHLAREAGQDLAAGSIVADLIKFLAKDPARPRSAIVVIESDPALTALLPGALIAGSQINLDEYTAQTLRLVRSDVPEIKRDAIFALSRLHWDDSKPPEEVFSALEQEQNNAQNDQLLATIARTATAIARLGTDQEARMLAVADSALTKGGEYSIHAAADVLAYADTDISKETIDLLLKHLSRVNPENRGTIQSINYGLMRLLKRGKIDEALAFLADLLVAKNVDPARLDAALAEVRKDQVILNRVSTRWFLAGTPALCRAVEWIIGRDRLATTKIGVDASEIDLANPAQVQFISKKIAAYLFFNPVSAASMLVSVIDSASDPAVASRVGQVLLDPILLNFPGTAQEYVESEHQSGSKTKKKIIKQVLKALEEYFDDLRSIETIPELHPPEAHLEAYHRKQTRQMADAMKSAEEQSPLLSLARRQTILYGRSSINYIHGAEGEMHRQEMQLRAHSVAIEVPRVANLDPLGLDYQLRTFKMEAWKA